jgi:hypothetical protein
MPPLFEPDTHRFGGSCHVYTCEAREQSQRRQALTGVFIHTDRLVLTGLDGLRRSLVRIPDHVSSAFCVGCSVVDAPRQKNPYGPGCFFFVSH